MLNTINATGKKSRARLKKKSKLLSVLNFIDNISTHLSIQIEICWGVIVVHVRFCGSFSGNGLSGGTLIETDSWLLLWFMLPLVKGLKSSKLSVVMIGIEALLCKNKSLWASISAARRSGTCELTWTVRLLSNLNFLLGSGDRSWSLMDEHECDFCRPPVTLPPPDMSFRMGRGVRVSLKMFVALTW